MNVCWMLLHFILSSIYYTYTDLFSTLKRYYNPLFFRKRKIKLDIVIINCRSFSFISHLLIVIFVSHSFWWNGDLLFMVFFLIFFSSKRDWIKIELYVYIVIFELIYNVTIHLYVITVIRLLHSRQMNSAFKLNENAWWNFVWSQGGEYLWMRGFVLHDFVSEWMCVSGCGWMCAERSCDWPL